MKLARRRTNLITYYHNQQGGSPDVSYTQQDLFATNLAVGAVNATASEPGPGTRGVVDTSGAAVSIIDGELFISGGSGVFASAGLWLTPGVARQTGKVLAIDFRLPLLSVNTSSLKMGWHTAANGALGSDLGMLIEASGAISLRRTSGANSPVIGSIAALTQYKLFSVMRVQGMFHILKSGATYRMLYENQWDTTPTLYPVVTSRVTDGDIYVKEMAVPELVFEITPEASDSFNRANGALGNSDGAGHLEANGGDGLAWSDSIGTWAIASNVAGASVLSGGIAIATVDTSKADVYAQAKLTRSAGNVGIVVRYVDSSNYVYAYHDGTNATLRKVVGGVDSAVVAATAATYSAGAKLEITCEGTAFRLFYNQVLIGTGTIADAALQTGTRQGLFTSNTGNTFEDFVCFKRTGWDAIDV